MQSDLVQRTTTIQRTNTKLRMDFLFNIVYYKDERPRCGPSEFRTTDRIEFPLLLHRTKSVSLNGHSLTHIKIYYSSDNFNLFVPDPALKLGETGWLLRIFKNSYFIARTFRLHTQVPNALEKHLK